MVSRWPALAGIALAAALLAGGVAVLSEDHEPPPPLPAVAAPRHPAPRPSVAAPIERSDEPTHPPSASPAPEHDWDSVWADLDEVEALPVQALTRAEWAAWAERLHAEVVAIDALPPAVRAEHREEQLRLHLLSGRAASQAEAHRWPFFGQVDGTDVNVGWYRAGVMLERRPELWDLVPEGGAEAVAVEYYAAALHDGDLPQVVPHAIEMPRDP